MQTKIVNNVARILEIPPELLIAILSYLNHRHLLKSGLVCRTFYEIVKDSLELQYNIELAADGMVDGPRTPGSLRTADRYRLLLDRRLRWRTLDWTRQVTVPLVGACQAYELVGGVFAKSMGMNGVSGSRHLIATWLPSRTEGEHSIVRDDLGIPSRDFAIDPTQDLIALVDVDDRHPANLKIRVHLRTISTNTPHKQAVKPELDHPIPFQIGNCFIQIVEDVVGMFFWLHGPGLIVWNWRTGETIVVCVHTQQAGIGSELHPGTWDFAFLSARAFMLTTVGQQGSIEIYSFSGHTLEPGVIPSPTHICSLRLPAVKDQQELHQFSTHSAPFLGGDIIAGKPFAASQENRVHLMLFHYGAQGRRFHLFVKNDFLLSHIPAGFGSNEPHTRKILPWEAWGPQKTRFLEHNVQFQWLRYVHGQRVVLPPFPYSTTPNRVCKVCVIDFNVHPKRLDDPCNEWMHRLKYSYDPDYEIICKPAVIQAGDLFENDVTTYLPYAVSTRMGPFNYSGFMIDEERLVGMRLSMSFAENDLSDIDVFTF